MNEILREYVLLTWAQFCQGPEPQTHGEMTVLALLPVPMRDGEAFLWFVCECRKMSTIVSPYMPYLYPSDCSPAETFPTEIS